VPSEGHKCNLIRYFNGEIKEQNKGMKGREGVKVEDSKDIFFDLAFNGLFR
jgi:hypothetical protein